MGKGWGWEYDAGEVGRVRMGWLVGVRGDKVGKGGENGEEVFDGEWIGGEKRSEATGFQLV